MRQGIGEKNVSWPIVGGGRREWNAKRGARDWGAKTRVQKDPDRHLMTLVLNCAGKKEEKLLESETGKGAGVGLTQRRQQKKKSPVADCQRRLRYRIGDGGEKNGRLRLHLRPGF